MPEGLFLGIDVGSTTVKVAGVSADGRPTGRPVYLRQDQFDTPLLALQVALSQFMASGDWQVIGAGTTGSGRELTCSLLRADLSRTEILAHAAGVSGLIRLGLVTDRSGRAINRVGTLLEIGGQDSKVIIFGADGLPKFFHMNAICSAGTGEFLKQLADEAGIAVADFGRLACQSLAPAQIDSTCTVFARRDFRHLTQKGVPLPDRLMGVCQALVRNYLRSVVPEGTVTGPVLFQGGVAYNQGVRSAFETQLGMPVLVPPMHDVIGALGMAWLTREQAKGGGDSQFRVDFARMQFESQVRFCHGCPNACELVQPQVVCDGNREVLPVVGGRCEGCRNVRNVSTEPQPIGAFAVPVARDPLVAVDRPRLFSPTHSLPRRRSGGRVQRSAGRFFAGIDGGSRGTKYALIQSTGDDLDIVAVGSLSTGGDALAACLEAVRRLAAALPAGARLDGVGTTGSAGEMFRDMLCTRNRATSDYQCTEILAHYAWASHWVPDVATVIDIGGNDAKIICLKPGGFDFAMNDKCAAGTGAFLEAVARRFHVPLGEYAAVAAQADNPARIAGRCAVFGESDVVHKSRIGFATPDLLQGVAHAICRTYLTDVARGRTLRLPIVAQGGVFLNGAVSSAFREVLGLSATELRVHDDPQQVVGAGALGAALLAKGMYERGYESSFKGFAHVLAADYQTATTRCRHANCHRTCDGVVVLLENGRPIAGYRAVDCRLGLFEGLTDDEGEQAHMKAMLAAGNDVGVQ